MKLNYKKIGNYIRQVNNRNTGLKVTNLKGININKEFMPSVANINGTDLSKYKIVKKGQFAFNPMHVGRDEMLPIALWLENDPIIVSPAYIVFDVINKNLLDPKYLMMWCSRKEFDRNCWFTTDSSVRGGFSWDNLCDLNILIPNIKDQTKIIEEFHTIDQRIKILEKKWKFNHDFCISLFKKHFIDFENLIDSNHSLCLVKDEDYDFLYPSDWEITELSKIINIKHGFAFKGDFFSNEANDKVLLSPGNFKIGGGFQYEGIKFYNSVIKEEYILKKNDLIITMTDLSKQADTLGYPALIPQFKGFQFLHNQRLGKVEFLSDFSFKYVLYLYLCSINYRNHIVSTATGTTVKHTSPSRIMSYKIPINKDIKYYINFEKLVKPFFTNNEDLLNEILILKELREILNSKMVRISE